MTVAIFRHYYMNLLMKKSSVYRSKICVFFLLIIMIK